MYCGRALAMLPMNRLSHSCEQVGTFLPAPARDRCSEAGSAHPAPVKSDLRPRQASPLHGGSVVAKERSCFRTTFRGPCTEKQETLRRQDGIAAYHLATVVGDAFQGISHVVRGSDFLAAVPQHICLQKLLALPVPEYAHVPLVTTPGQIQQKGPPAAASGRMSGSQFKKRIAHPRSAKAPGSTRQPRRHADMGSAPLAPESGTAGRNTLKNSV